MIFINSTIYKSNKSLQLSLLIYFLEHDKNKIRAFQICWLDLDQSIK